MTNDNKSKNNGTLFFESDECEYDLSLLTKY